MTRKLVCAALLGATLGWMSVTVWAGPPDRKDFLSDAIKGDNSEIRLGQLAARHGGSSGVREYGRTLVTDHTKAKAQASDVARQIGVEPPSGAMLKADVEYAKLRVLSRCELANGPDASAGVVAGVDERHHGTSAGELEIRPDMFT